MQIRISVWGACLWLLSASLALADDPPPPQITGIGVTNNQRTVRWAPYPHAQQYNVLGASNVAGPYVSAPGTVSGYSWTGTNNSAAQFYTLGVSPLSSNALLTAQVLNRLAYGPTPDELERVLAMGPDAYIAEQLAPENLPEPTANIFYAVATNGNPYAPPWFTGDTGTNWVYVSRTGVLTNGTVYMYLTQVGEGYIADVQLREGTNPTNLGPNLLANGDFSQTLSNGWTVSSNHRNSHVTNNPTCGTNNSLHLITTSAGSSQSTAIWQQVPTNNFTYGTNCTLSFWYLPSTNYRPVTVRLSGRGVDLTGSPLAPPAQPQWLFYHATGPATSTTLYLYLTEAGETYMDDIRLVAGTVPAVGANLLRNGDFEQPFVPADWTVSSNHTNSMVVTNISKSGLASLKLVATSAGSSQGTSIYQTNLPVTLSNIYTLSFWYLYDTNRSDFTIRLSGSGITRNQSRPFIGRLELREASIGDLRAWFCNNAVTSSQQLLEVLSQFLENHFVTQYSKSQDYFANVANNTPEAGNWATDLEYREWKKWRQALKNPQCTFYDLLKIHAESPAEIIYLDTVNSRSDGGRIANENYARELLELFCFGVDNGYDQADIVQMSRAWTGWSVEIVEPHNIDNPHASQSPLYRVPGSGAVSNIAGVWTFNYKPTRHWYYPTSPIVIFPGKTVPARFGSPWAGRNYELALPPRTGTNGILDGYDVIAHMANQPFTQEYLCIKLCRLFVHDDFPNPTTKTDLPEYQYYNYANLASLTPEARLVHACMMAWETSNPKGQIRAVLNTIFNSELFRAHHGALQKVKTPLEFCVSAVRALRSVDAGGSSTVFVDGADFETPLNRMGNMSLFNRGDPDGYPEAGPAWISAGTLAERLRFVQALLHTSTSPSDAGDNEADPLSLFRRKRPGQETNDGAVADYFLGILFPGEGKANLDLYRRTAIRFLNTADDGVTSSLYSGLSSANRDTRVRGMAAMLMTLQRFQEQ
jgi:uncharacterized protein (DUF1800 family)